MEKWKITRELENEFEEYMSCGGSCTDVLESYVRDFKHHKELKRHFPNLATLTIEQFALLLCGWYEVVQSFEVGDWVFDNDDNRYCKITSIEHGFFRIDNCKVNKSYANNHFEKVTESWKIKLLELGRKKTEFKIGDKYITKDGTPISIYDKSSINTTIRMANSNVIKYFYPVESRIEFD